MSEKKIPQKIRKNIKEYINVLKQENLPIEKVYLFGSYAKGTQHKWSDIDLCIISPKFTDPWDAMRYLWTKRIRDDGITIEPVGFSTKDMRKGSPLIAEIKKTGIELTV